MQEEKYVPNYKCKDCAYLKRQGTNISCPCFDHNKIEHAAPWFVSSPEENGFPCNKFEPSSIHVYDLKNYWVNYNTWLSDWIQEWNNSKEFNDCKWFTIGKDRSIRYGMSMLEYINGNIIINGKLNCFQKMYYRRSQSSPIGYELIIERCEPVNIIPEE